VLVNNVAFAVTNVAINSSVVQLTLGSVVGAGNTVSVSYNAPTPDSWTTNSAIQDTAGNDAALLSGYSVASNAYCDINCWFASVAHTWVISAEWHCSAGFIRGTCCQLG
jgi:hypothetical protein